MIFSYTERRWLQVPEYAYHVSDVMDGIKHVSRRKTFSLTSGGIRYAPQKIDNEQRIDYLFVDAHLESKDLINQGYHKYWCVTFLARGFCMEDEGIVNAFLILFHLFLAHVCHEHRDDDGWKAPPAPSTWA